MKQHQFVSIGVAANEVPFHPPHRWYWCSWCGVLSRDFVEYWLPNIVFPEGSNLNSRSLPKGHVIAPACVNKEHG